MIICSELSRLGRNLYMIMEILNVCMRRECVVRTIKDGYCLGDDIQSKVLAFAFGLSAEIERNLISQRTREALARLKAEGHILGRPKGSKSKFRKLDGKENQVLAMRNEGLSIAAIAKKMNVSRKTIYRVLYDCNTL